MPAPLPAAAATGRPHLYWIDWLRFLAAFAVVAEHARNANWAGPRFSLADSTHPFARCLFFSATTLGNPAVVIFFVLSGWLVGGLVLEKVRAGTFDAAAYAADRLARVYVPLVPALLFTAAAVRAFDEPLDPVRYLGCLVGFQGSYMMAPGQNTPLWTLSYEMWFYVLAGCVAALCRRGGTRTQRLLAGAGAALAVVQCLHLEWDYCACWLVGVAGPWMRGLIGPRVRGGLAAASVLVVAVAVVIEQIAAGVLPRAFALLPRAFALLSTMSIARGVMALGALVLAACLADLAPATHAGRRLERMGTALAGFSYTLYLTHYPVLWSLVTCQGRMSHMLDGPSIWRYGWWLAICLGVALGMYALFEARTPQVRRWLRVRFTAGQTSGRLVTAAPLAANLLG